MDPMLRILKMRDAAATEGEKTLKKNKMMHESVTATWTSANKPKWFISYIDNGRVGKLKVGYKAKQARKLRRKKAVYWLLNKGTKVKRVIFTADFKRKTTPKQLGSTAGSGRVLTVNRNITTPGIEAGNWDQVIAAELRTKLIHHLAKGYKKGYDRTRS